MGTRGAIIFTIDGHSVIQYNHYDSYPTGLGKSISKEWPVLLKRWPMDVLRERVRELRQVSEDGDPPSEEAKHFLEKYSNLGVSEKSLDDWYCLLHRCQGKLIRTLESGHIMGDMDSMVNDGTAFSFIYVLDFDAECLEVYEGFQRREHVLGWRGAAMPDARGFWPPALISSTPFGSIESIDWEAMEELTRED